jgi:hypothetical protein
LGWDALVAIGTIGLALGTFLLAWSTRTAALRAAEDIRSQWRPALIPGDSAEPSFSLSELEEEEFLLAVEVVNVGRGAAYDIDPGLDLGDSVVPASLWASKRQGAENLAVLPVDRALDLKFTHLGTRPDAGKVIIDYKDLNGRPYVTTVTLDLLPLWDDQDTKVLRIAGVSLEDGRERIPWKPPNGTAGEVSMGICRKMARFQPETCLQAERWPPPVLSVGPIRALASRWPDRERPHAALQVLSGARRPSTVRRLSAAHRPRGWVFEAMKTERGEEDAGGPPRSPQPSPGGSNPGRTRLRL